jgi:hypothetical protein
MEVMQFLRIRIDVILECDTGKLCGVVFGSRQIDAVEMSAIEAISGCNALAKKNQ